MLPSLNELATAILDDPPDMASFLAHVMISDRPTDPNTPGRLVRMKSACGRHRDAGTRAALAGAGWDDRRRVHLSGRH